MLRSRLLCAASVLALASLGPLPAGADEVIEPKPMTRKFPQGQFCSLPVTISFVAPAVPIRITYTALEFVDAGGGNLEWTNQSIDNVTIATTAQVSAHTSGPPSGGSSENCYIGDPTPVTYFHFNDGGLTLDLIELFDTDPTSRGWDMSDGGLFSTDSAPRDVNADNDFSGGALQLGDGSGTPSASATSSTSIVVPGLTEGASYDLGTWWQANFVRFPHDTVYLTITIETEDGTPVAQKSWGGLKKSYR